MFIETAFLMKPDGTLGHQQRWNAGMYIRCDDVRAVELLRPPPDPDQRNQGRPDGEGEG